MIVDDTQANVRVLADYLESRGFAVMIAQDGEEGVERAQFGQPDLILLDVMMSGMNGLEACRSLKANDGTRDIPVIFMTALSGIDDKIAGYNAGGVDYVTKPFQMEEVLARINTHLNLRTMQKQLAAQNEQLQKYREALEQQVAERTAELRKSNSQLHESQYLLRQLAARNEAVREEERKHVSREIHDELGQYLSALRLGVSVVGLEFGESNPLLQEKTQSMVALVDTTIKVVRNIVAALRPAVLDMGIVSSLEWLLDEFVEHTGIACELHVGEDNFDLDDRSATAIFRIVQESLTNIRRHAEASKVDISLEKNGGCYLLEVRDNGVGFDPAIRKIQSFGLIGIRERILTLGGGVDISSAPESGAVIRISIPVEVWWE